MRGPILLPALAVALSLVAPAATATAGGGQAHRLAPAAPTTDPEPHRDQAMRLLEEATEASTALAYRGRLVLSAFTEPGPELTTVRLTRDEDGLQVRRGETWELGRVGDEAYLRTSTGTLLRLSGIERGPVDLERLGEKYALRLTGTERLVTGDAVRLLLVDRRTGATRERLYVDEDSDLIVRRETYGADGEPRRVVAFTELEIGPGDVATPQEADYDREERLRAADLTELAERGYEVPEALPGGYELVTGYAVEDEDPPRLHLVFHDGLYSLSLYQQRGRLAADAVSGATAMRAGDGGRVWRWPGSEPRRVVWSADGLTFTALSDAPTDELLSVVSGLPTQRPPSTLARLGRGLSRLGEWLRITDRSS